MSLVANTGSPLTTLDLSGNIIGDRGMKCLLLMSELCNISSCSSI